MTSFDGSGLRRWGGPDPDTRRQRERRSASPSSVVRRGPGGGGFAGTERDTRDEEMRLSLPD